MLAKANLKKGTRYRPGKSEGRTILEVRQETWSRTFLSPPTTTVSMKLMSAKRKLFWSKTEPVDSRSAQAVVEDLLKNLAKAEPKIR